MLHIQLQEFEGLRRKNCNIRVGPSATVEELIKLYVSEKSRVQPKHLVPNPEDCEVFCDGLKLDGNKTLRERNLDIPNRKYVLQIFAKKPSQAPSPVQPSAPQSQAQPSTAGSSTSAPVAAQSQTTATPEEKPAEQPQQETKPAAASTSAEAAPAATAPAAEAKKETKKKKKPKTAVEVKLRIQEKVENQVIGCDITASSNMKFSRISAMYCTHRSYKPENYIFACDGVLMEDAATLSALGLDTAGQTYVIHVYHKDKVNIADE